MKKWHLVVMYVGLQFLVGSKLILMSYEGSKSKFDVTDVYLYLYGLAGYVLVAIALIFLTPKVVRKSIIITSIVCFWPWAFAPYYYPIIVEKMNQRELNRWREQSIQNRKQNNLEFIQARGVEHYSWNEERKHIEVKSVSGNAFWFEKDPIYGELSAYCRFNSDSPCDTAYSLKLIHEAIDMFMLPKTKSKLDSLLKINQYSLKCQEFSDYLYIRIPPQTISSPIQIQAGLVQGDTCKTFYCEFKDPSLIKK